MNIVFCLLLINLTMIISNGSINNTINDIFIYNNIEYPTNVYILSVLGTVTTIIGCVMTLYGAMVFSLSKYDIKTMTSNNLSWNINLHPLKIIKNRFVLYFLWQWVSLLLFIIACASAQDVLELLFKNNINELSLSLSLNVVVSITASIISVVLVTLVPLI